MSANFCGVQVLGKEDDCLGSAVLSNVNRLIAVLGNDALLLRSVCLTALQKTDRSSSAAMPSTAVSLFMSLALPNKSPVCTVQCPLHVEQCYHGFLMVQLHCS